MSVVAGVGEGRGSFGGLKSSEGGGASKERGSFRGLEGSGGGVGGSVSLVAGAGEGRGLIESVRPGVTVSGGSLTEAWVCKS